MAIGTPTLKSSVDSNGTATTYVTGTSYTPTAGNLYVAWVGNGSATVDLPTFAGNALTWTQIATVLNGAGTRRLTVFAAEGTGGTAGVDGATFGVSQGSCNIQVFEITGVDVSSVATSPGTNKTIIQAPTTADAGAGTTATVGLAAGANVDNRNLSGFKLSGTGVAVSPKALWTELSELSTGPTLETQWRSDGFDPISTATWTGNNRWCAISLELKVLPLGWGTEPWGNFRWGEEALSPQQVTMNSVIDNMAVAFGPVMSRQQYLTDMPLVDNMAVAFGPSSFFQGDRMASSLVNLRRGVRRGTVRGRGAFRASARVRGLDQSSTVRGNYRTRGNAVPQRSGKQVTTGFVDNMATALSLSFGSFQLPLVDNMATALGMEFQQNRTVQLGFINQSAVAFAPSFGHINLDFIDNMAVAFDPYIPIETSLIDNMAVAFAPGFSGSSNAGQSITGMSVIDNMATAFQPESITRGAPQQLNTPFIDNMAQAITMFIKLELPTAIRLKASYDDEIGLEASYDDVIIKKVKIMGTKAPITKLDDWNEDEDQTFIWELPGSTNVTGWTARFRLADENGGPHLLEYFATVLSSVELSIASPAVDTAGLGGKQYFYEFARIDAGYHQRIAHGPAYLGARVS